MATQSHRSNGPRRNPAELRVFAGPRTAGPPESSPQRGLPRSLPARNAPGDSGTRAQMTSSGANSATGRGSRVANWLLACVLLLGAAVTARADDCSAYPGGVLDGFAGTPAPDNIKIDTNCTLRNY